MSDDDDERAPIVDRETGRPLSVGALERYAQRMEARRDVLVAACVAVRDQLVKHPAGLPAAECQRLERLIAAALVTLERKTP